PFTRTDGLLLLLLLCSVSVVPSWKNVEPRRSSNVRPNATAACRFLAEDMTTAEDGRREVKQHRPKAGVVGVHKAPAGCALLVAMVARADMDTTYVCISNMVADADALVVLWAPVFIPLPLAGFNHMVGGREEECPEEPLL
ncbi:unnamed protein product, partial [Ectocarpus sp. 12 AP-2014]